MPPGRRLRVFPTWSWLAPQGDDLDTTGCEEGLDSPLDLFWHHPNRRRGILLVPWRFHWYQREGCPDFPAGWASWLLPWPLLAQKCLTGVFLQWLLLPRGYFLKVSIMPAPPTFLGSWLWGAFLIGCLGFICVQWNLWFASFSCEIEIQTQGFATTHSSGPEASSSVFLVPSTFQCLSYVCSQVMSTGPVTPRKDREKHFYPTFLDREIKC